MSIFDKYADKYDSFMIKNNLYNIEAIRKHMNFENNDCILDVWWWTWYIANNLKPFVKEITILDKSEKMLEQAKNYNNIKTIHWDILTMNMKKDSYDWVICVDSIHHIRNFDKLISKFNRILKPDWKILIYDFDIKWLKWLGFYLLERIFVDRSEFLKPEILAEKMEQYWFEWKIVIISELQYLYVWKNINENI